VSQGLDLALGIGNILDHVSVDGRGRGTSTGDNAGLKKVAIKFPKLDKTTKMTAGTPDKRMAKVTVMLTGTQMVARGFGTEGVDPAGNGKQLSIQVALVLAGVAYESQVPVTLKVARKQDAGSIGMSRAGR
jgi:hypothetical protein